MLTEFDQYFLHVSEIEAWKEVSKIRFFNIFKTNQWHTLPSQKIPMTYVEYVCSFPQYKAGMNAAIDHYVLPQFPYYWLTLQIKQGNVPEFPKLYLDLPMDKSEAHNILTLMRLEGVSFRNFINKIVTKRDHDYLRFFGAINDEIGFLILFFAYANDLNLKNYVEYVSSSIQLPQFYNYLEEIKDYEMIVTLQSLFPKKIELIEELQDIRPISLFSVNMILSPEYIYRYNKENLDILAYSTPFREKYLNKICSIYNNGTVSGKKSAFRFLHALQGRNKLTDAIIGGLIIVSP